MNFADSAHVGGVLQIVGEVVAVTGASIIARLPRASTGDLCWIETRSTHTLLAQVIGFNESLFSLAPFREPEGVYPGARVVTKGTSLSIPVGEGLLGRVIGAMGNPLDGIGIRGSINEMRSIHRSPPSPIDRPLITEPLTSGIRSIDGFCTLGIGQRIGVFASAGVGKSTLLGMLARQAAVDVTVVALVGERGREVREFTEDTLGECGTAKSVVVVATSDEPSLVRQLAPYTATTIAEYFRDHGKNVLLIIDSLTRMARAVRETSLAAGELPVRHGYTSSVYTELPKLVERAGTASRGSITAVYTVLTNEEDDVDPLADEVKSLLDGHLVLRKQLAIQGVLPAIDVTTSISRLFNRFHNPLYRQASRIVVSAMSRLYREKDIVLLGGIPDAQLARILSLEGELMNMVRQELDERTGSQSTIDAVLRMSERLTS